MSSGWTALETSRPPHVGVQGRLQAHERWRLLLVLATFVVVGVLTAAAASAIAPATAVRLASLIGLGLLGSLVASAALSRFERLQRRGYGPRGGGSAAPAPRMLERTERRLELAVSFAASYEQLRRELRAIAEQRLGGRGLQFESEAARQLLGADAWALLAKPCGADGFAAGVERARLEDLLQALESV